MPILDIFHQTPRKFIRMQFVSNPSHSVTPGPNFSELTVQPLHFWSRLQAQFKLATWNLIGGGSIPPFFEQQIFSNPRDVTLQVTFLKLVGVYLDQNKSTEIQTNHADFDGFCWPWNICYTNLVHRSSTVKLGRSYDRNLVNGCQWWGLLYFRVIEAGQKSGQLLFCWLMWELYERSRCCSNVSGFLVNMNSEMILFCLIEDSSV